MRVAARRQLAEDKTLVIGADPSAVLTARALPGEVHFRSLSPELVRRVSEDVAAASVIDDPQRLASVADHVEAAIVATPTDGLNLLYAQTLRVDHGVTDIVVRLSDPANAVALSELDVASVCTATEISRTLVDSYERLVV